MSNKICIHCKKELDEDSVTLINYRMPNAFKFATNAENLEKIEKLSDVWFCSSSCSTLSNLNTICSMPIKEETKEVASILGLMLIMEHESPEFVEEIRKLQRMW